MRYYLLIAVFVVGSIINLLIVFGEKRGWADFLVDNWLVNHLFGWLDEVGLSKTEKMLFHKRLRIRKSSRKELEGEFQEILQKHAGRYEETEQFDRSLITWLPLEIQKFFETYDYLRFYDENVGRELELVWDVKVLDIKALKIVEIKGVPYIVIGMDEGEEEYFVVKQEKTDAESGEIFRVDMELNSEGNLKENTKTGIGWPSLRHVVCEEEVSYLEWLEPDEKER